MSKDGTQIIIKRRVYRGLIDTPGSDAPNTKVEMTLEELKQWEPTTRFIRMIGLTSSTSSPNRSSGDPYEIVQRSRRADRVYRWFQNSGRGRGRSLRHVGGR